MYDYYDRYFVAIHRKQSTKAKDSDIGLLWKEMSVPESQLPPGFTPAAAIAIRNVIRRLVYERMAKYCKYSPEPDQYQEPIQACCDDMTKHFNNAIEYFDIPRELW